MPPKKISYNNAISEIENILSEIENNELDVDSLSMKVKKVDELLKICKNKLSSTEKDVESILNSMKQE